MTEILLLRHKTPAQTKQNKNKTNMYMIKMLLQEQPDLGLICLPKPLSSQYNVKYINCPSTSCNCVSLHLANSNQWRNFQSYYLYFHKHHLRNRKWLIGITIWAATWQNQQNECASSEDSDQPGHPPSLIRVFAARMKKHSVLSYPLSAQRRLWSDWADAQADLSLCWAHSHFVGFVMLRLNYYKASMEIRCSALSTDFKN